MTKMIFRNFRRMAALMLCLFPFSPLQQTVFSPSAHANTQFGYTEENPLVIVSDWDFRPFEFIDESGHPAGYNVEVLSLILDRLGIPHKFVMLEWHMATERFTNHEADLIHALYFFYNAKPYVATKKYINYYRLKVARRAETKPLTRLADFGITDTLLVKEDDYAALGIAAKGPATLNTRFSSPKEGLTSVLQGRYNYYIWGEEPLVRKVKELGIDDFVLDPIDIPAGELRIIGYNKELVDIIDDQFARLEQAGELQAVYDRWFHPERVHDDTSPVALFILGGLLMAVAFIALLIYLVRRRVAVTVKESDDTGKMMRQVLNMGSYYVVEWDVNSNMLRNKYSNMLPYDNMKPSDFYAHLPAEDAEHLHSLNMKMVSGEINHFDIVVRYNQGTVGKPLWRYFYGNAIDERENGKLKYVVFTTKDITAAVNEEKRIHTVASKYVKIFETGIVAMSFYDADGQLVGANSKMRDFCRFSEGAEAYFYEMSLFDFPSVKGVYLPGTRETMNVCQHYSDKKLGIDKYVEFGINPVINDDDEVVYYIITSRDVTDERQMYLEQRQHDRQLHATNEAVRLYEYQLRSLLEESDMSFWSYRPAEDKITLTQSPGKNLYTQTLEEFLESANPKIREEAKQVIAETLKNGTPYNVVLPFDYTPLEAQPKWYSISGMPVFNKEHQLVEYFGLTRDITGLMKAQEQLKVETARAQDSGQLKAAFLANMTHEIRTPLNAIVGFSDLLPVVDTKEEKLEFIRIIRNNCDMLLRLINDILEASNIESRPLAIEPVEVDFAQTFDDICQTLAQRVDEPGVTFVKDNPYKSFRTILDKDRMQQVITNFVTNAVKYTKEGHIRVGYLLTGGKEQSGEGGGQPAYESLPFVPDISEEGLYMYCEDTGVGIPKEKQASVFDRFVKLNEFVQGTGLGLSISKSIAERYNGKIGVYSKGEGHGSTFWIWIPCTFIEVVSREA